MPRPEYKHPEKGTIYLDVSAAIKERFLDLCHALGANQNQAFVFLIEEYLEKNAVPKRPSLKKK